MSAPALEVLSFPGEDEGLPLIPLPQSSPRAERQPGLLKRLSSRHHRLAQCLAAGVKPGEAAVLCGYVASRVSILQTDPAFKELIDFYSAQKQAEFLGTARKLAEVAETAVDILQERLEDKPDEFSTTQLLAVATTALDRTGLGPSSTQKNVNVVVTAEQLIEIKRRVLSTQPSSVKLLPAQSADARSAEGSAESISSLREESLSTEGPPLRAESNEESQNLE